MNQWCMTNWTILFLSSRMLAYCHSQHHSSPLCLSFFLSCVLPLSIPAPILCCFCLGCCLSCVPSRHVAVVTAVKGMRERENYHFFNSLYLPSLHLSVHTMPCQLPLLSITFFFLPPESISHPVLNCYTRRSHIFVSQDSLTLSSCPKIKVSLKHVCLRNVCSKSDPSNGFVSIDKK